MKALSIKQPWAWLIIHGGKDIENRTWRTNHYGALLIHAGQRIDPMCRPWVEQRFPHIVIPPDSELRVGGVIGVATLLACCTFSPSPWYDGSPNAWVLDKAKELPFTKMRGQLGLFDVRLEEDTDLYRALISCKESEQ